MTEAALPLDIAELPEAISALAHEVARSGRPRVLREHNADIAMIIPMRTHRTERSHRGNDAAALEAFLSTAGGWKDLVDVEELKSRIKRARGSSRSPVRL